MAAHTASAVAGATELTRSRTANNQMNVYKSEQETNLQNVKARQGPQEKSCGRGARPYTALKR